jgi:hypothetical protein
MARDSITKFRNCVQIQLSEASIEEGFNWKWLYLMELQLQLLLPEASSAKSLN